MIEKEGKLTVQGVEVKTWTEVKLFIDLHHLPMNVFRFNMSLRGCLIDLATGKTLADSLQAATAYLKGQR